jgi:site-specific recombinase XerD
VDRTDGQGQGAGGLAEGRAAYQARHSVALEPRERGVDLADVSAVLAHRQIAMTRRHYAPVLVSRLQGVSEQLGGRFGGWLPETPRRDAQDEPDNVH